MWSLIARISGEHDIAAYREILDRMERTVSRVEEIRQVAEPERFVWIAGQLDEIHSELSGAITEMRGELGDIKGRLTGVLIAIVTAAVTIPLSIIWAAIQGASGG